MTPSKLGLGVMRWPDVPSRKESEEIVGYAMENGVTYFETAFGYNKGNCQRIVGELLKGYKRDTYHVCAKMPMLSNVASADYVGFFENQLSDVGVGFFDFYLAQFFDRNSWGEAEKYVSFVEEEKKRGRIVNAGFSFHDDEEWLLQYLDLYTWDCVQIPLNFVDWFRNNHEKLYKILYDRKIPIIVMGALKGGNLSHYLPKPAMRLLHNADSERPIASWGMQFSSNLKGVQTVLSGAVTLEELKGNVDTVIKGRWGGVVDQELLLNASEKFLEQKYVPCNYCGYCEGKCPINKPIPKTFRLYNSLLREYSVEDKQEYDKIQHDMGIGFMACKGCGECNRACPQKLDVQKLVTSTGFIYR